MTISVSAAFTREATASSNRSTAYRISIRSFCLRRHGLGQLLRQVLPSPLPERPERLPKFMAWTVLLENRLYGANDGQSRSTLISFQPGNEFADSAPSGAGLEHCQCRYPGLQGARFQF